MSRSNNNGLKLYRVQDDTRHCVEWYGTHFQAKQRAREMVGLHDNQPIADIVDIFECQVSRSKEHLLVSLNHGGWHGDEKKVDEVNQDGFVTIINWTTTQESVWAKKPEEGVRS